VIVVGRTSVYIRVRERDGKMRFKNLSVYIYGIITVHDVRSWLRGV